MTKSSGSYKSILRARFIPDLDLYTKARRAGRRRSTRELPKRRAAAAQKFFFRVEEKIAKFELVHFQRHTALNIAF